MDYITFKLPRKTIDFFYFLILTSCAINEVSGQNGTTIGIKDIFADRCNIFQEQNLLRKNCTKLWELFLNSFANKMPCEVTPESYLPFFNEANYTTSIVNKSLFWAFTNPFVYNFSASQQGKYMTILDLLPGYVLNDLKWCWSLEKDDLDYVSCPSYKECQDQHEAVKSFWTANSQMFAGLSTGGVFAMLNGSVSSGAFTNRSLFYTAEVPAMAYPRIKELHVILVHDPEIHYTEGCFNGTLTILRNILTQKQIGYSCSEDPPEVRNLQCNLYPGYRKTDYCMASGDHSNQHHAFSMLSSIAFGFFTILIQKYPYCNI